MPWIFNEMRFQEQKIYEWLIITIILMKQLIVIRIFLKYYVYLILFFAPQTKAFLLAF